jgi:cellobiose-specific phosphotransferase system component IIA
LDFGDRDDVLSTTHWQVPRRLAHDRAARTRASDAREFALLAAKRWRHYHGTQTAARSLSELHRMISSDAQGEYCRDLTLRCVHAEQHRRTRMTKAELVAHHHELYAAEDCFTGVLGNRHSVVIAKPSRRKRASNHRTPRRRTKTTR